MNKKLGSVLHSHVWLYFVMMGGFALATALMGQYMLAAAEAGLTILVILVAMIHKRNRRWETQQFLNKITDVQAGTKGVESPFPTCVIRMPDGEVLYANKRDTKRYVFKVTAIASDEIVLDCDCPPAIIHLRKGEPYSYSYSFDGYEDHDGCVWNGEDENIYVIWQ